LIAYKNGDAGELPVGVTLYDSLSIDNEDSWIGSLDLGLGGAVVKDSKIYGELKDNMECYPYGYNCSCTSITGVSPLISYVDTEIIGFDDYTQGCGGSQFVVRLVSKAYEDEMPFFEMTNMLFTDLAFSAFAYFGLPKNAPSNTCGPF